MYTHIVRTKKEMLYVLITTYGPTTCERLEQLTLWKHQTVSARLTELYAAGRIAIGGGGLTSSGRGARKYVTTR